MNDRINYWLSAPVFHDDEDKTRKSQILHMLQSSMIAALLLATLGTVFVFVNIRARAERARPEVVAGTVRDRERRRRKARAAPGWQTAGRVPG